MVNIKRILLICKLARIRLGKTQKEISEESGYNLNTISSFENGQLRNIKVYIYYFENILDQDERKEFLKSWLQKDQV